jgi:hypothetical protein
VEAAQIDILAGGEPFDIELYRGDAILGIIPTRISSQAGLSWRSYDIPYQITQAKFDRIRLTGAGENTLRSIRSVVLSR